MKKLLRSKIKVQISTSCLRVVDGSVRNWDCGNSLVKNGITKYGKQRFLCQECKTTRVTEPKQYGYGNSLNSKIIQLTKEGLGIRSISRVLGISPSTVIRKILKITEGINAPRIPTQLGRIQIDELHTFFENRNFNL